LEVILKIIGEITLPALRAGRVISPDVFEAPSTHLIKPAELPDNQFPA